MTNEKTARRPIGQILVDGGFIAGHDLETALKEQQKTNELLGQMLIKMELIDRPELEAALSVQGHLATLEDAVKVAAGIRLKLGSLLLMTGKITGEQLDLALSEQRLTGDKLGGILINKGLLTESQVSSVLSFQQNQETQDPYATRFRLGEILVSSGDITKDQLNDALQKQNVSRKRLGEILVEEGYAHLHQVNRGISLQQKLMRSVLVAVVSLAGVTMQGCGGGASPSPASSVSLSAANSVSTSAILNQSHSIKTNYLQMLESDYTFKSQPNFYYSTDNQSFWSIQANVADSVTDINSLTVFRMDIPKTGTTIPELNKTFSIEEGGSYDKFPGSFSVFDGQQFSRKKVEQGTITFTPDSVMSDRVSGDFTVVLTDYDSAEYPVPRYQLKGVFSFKIGEYAPAT